MKTLFSPILKSQSGYTLEVDKSALDSLHYRSGIYCNPLEIKILCWALQQLKGDYIEIGVNQGGTAVNVCMNNPERYIYGVDFIGQSTMHANQIVEQPNSRSVAHLCKDMRNFNLILHNSRTVKIPDNIGMVFIDGDHSYQGVKADTENILRQVKPGTVIMWHDYINNLHPEYMAVNKYIDNEIADKMQLWQFKETWLIAGITK